MFSIPRRSRKERDLLELPNSLLPPWPLTLLSGRLYDFSAEKCG